MAFNGSGSFSIDTAGNPVVTQTAISSTVFNTTMQEVASGLSTAICKDGQTTVTQNIPMANHKFTGMLDGSARADSATIGNVVDGTGVYVGAVGGTADAIALTPNPAITAYVAGQTFRFIAAGANTTNVTVAVSGLAVKAITKNGTTALVAGDIPASSMVEITYDGTRFILGTVGAASFVATANHGTITLDASVTVSDARTNTVDVPVTITSTTSDTPAAGIGVGILLRAESADENPSSFGQIEAVAADVGAGTEDTYFQLLTRVAGAALAATYRFIATAANKAILTHANSADRTYTLPDATGTIPTVADQAAATAMTSTTTALSPNVNKIINTAVTATTSGTSVDSPAFPAGVRRIIGQLSGVSSNGTSDYIIQLIDAGGVEATGYIGTVVGVAGGPSIGIGTPTTYFGLANSVVAAGVYDGQFILELMDSATFKWSYSSQLGATSTTATHFLATGTKALSAELTQVRLTTAGGVNTFDAGSIVWAYER